MTAKKESTWQELLEENKLLKSENERLEERLNAIFESAPDAYFIADHKGNFIDGNKAAEKLIGYKKEELIKKSFLKLDLISGNQIHKAGKLLAKQILGKSTGPDIFKLKRKDGNLVYVEIFTHPVKIENRKYNLNIARDISDRIIADEALRDSEEKFRTIFSNLSVGIVMIDKEGQIVLANQRFSEITGYRLSELLIKKNVDIIYPEDIPETKEKMKLLLEKKISGFRSQKRLVHKTGKIVWINVNVTPKYKINGEIDSMLGVMHDITESKLMEDDLKKLSISVEQSPVSTIITDINGIIEYVNPVFCELTGYTFEEARGKNPNILKSGEQTDEYYNNLWETITNGKVWKGEFHNKKKNGELFWEKATIGPIFNELGEISNFIALKEDISEQKEIEKELKKYRDDLENMVKERTHELEETNEKLNKNIKELQRYNELFVGREFRIKELKDRVKELEEKIK